MRTSRHLASAVVLLCTMAATAAPRVFTDTSGRTLNADVVSATADSVTLKLDTGAVHTLPLSRISEADRTFVQGWLKNNPATAQGSTSAAPASAGPVRYAFNVTWQKEKSGEKKVHLGVYRGEEEQWVCKFKITNLSPVPLEDVEVRYQVHMSLERGGKTATDEHVDGSEKVASLPRNQAVEVSAKAVPLLKLKLDGDYITTDGSRPTKRDSIKGVALFILHKGVTVHEFRTPGTPNAPWQASPSPKTNR